MPKIDPAARVALHAELADNVSNRPLVPRRAEVRFGEGCVLDSMVVVDGHDRDRTPLPASPRRGGRHRPPGSEVRRGPIAGRIGADCVFREYCTLNRSTGEGEDNGRGSGNSRHGVCPCRPQLPCGRPGHLSPTRPISPGMSTVADQAIVGGVTPVHQFVKIGCHAIIGGGFAVPMDVAPYVQRGGQPSAGRRAQLDRTGPPRLHGRGCCGAETGSTGSSSARIYS